MKLPTLLLKSTDGKPSYSLTMVVAAFIATLLWFVLSIFTHIKGFDIRAFDGGSAMAFLSPLLLNYYGAKHLDRANAAAEDKEEPAA
jgi:hypothetical protein